MAKSPEYPDLAWIPPRAWETSNRRPKWIVIHTTEGAKNGMAAEDGAAYTARRTDSTSCHYHVDNNSVVQSVRTKDVSYCAFYDGNMGGIQYELCTRGDSADWTDSYHAPMLALAAKQIARDCKKWGIEVRKLTISQLRGRSLTGFCGHVDISAAFEGDHHDPGANFPWSRFLGMVKNELEEDMPLTDADTKKIVDEFEDRLKDPGSALFANMRAISWKYPVDADTTPRSALRVFQDEDAQTDSLVADMALVRAENAELNRKLQEVLDKLNAGA
jgi:N-acetyl-anhydromuramyl-L-alanine amidase AmpD